MSIATVASSAAPMVARPLPTVDEVKARLNRLTQAIAKAKTIIGNEVYEVELRLKSLEQEARQQERSVNAIKAGNRLRTNADVDMISADGPAKSSVGGDGSAEGGGPSGGDVSALGTASTAEPAAEQAADGAVAGEGAALGLGLLAAGAGPQHAAELVAYARDTQHEKIIRACALGAALTAYGAEAGADGLIDTLCGDADPLLR